MIRMLLLSTMLVNFITGCASSPGYSSEKMANAFKWLSESEQRNSNTASGTGEDCRTVAYTNSWGKTFYQTNCEKR